MIQQFCSSVDRTEILQPFPSLYFIIFFQISFAYCELPHLIVKQNLECDIPCLSLKTHILSGLLNINTIYFFISASSGPYFNCFLLCMTFLTELFMYDSYFLQITFHLSKSGFCGFLVGWCLCTCMCCVTIDRQQSSFS